MDLTQGIPVSIQLKTVVKQAGEKNEFYFDVAGTNYKNGEYLIYSL